MCMLSVSDEATGHEFTTGGALMQRREGRGYLSDGEGRLLARVRSGDKTAYYELVRPYNSWILKLIWRRAETMCLVYTSQVPSREALVDEIHAYVMYGVYEPPPEQVERRRRKDPTYGPGSCEVVDPPPLMRSLQGFKGNCSAKTFITRVLPRLAADWRRRRFGRHPYVDSTLSIIDARRLPQRVQEMAFNTQLVFVVCLLWLYPRDWAAEHLALAETQVSEALHEIEQQFTYEELVRIARKALAHGVHESAP